MVNTPYQPIPNEYWVMFRDERGNTIPTGTHTAYATNPYEATERVLIEHADNEDIIYHLRNADHTVVTSEATGMNYVITFSAY